MAVTVEQHQMGILVVVPVSISVMNFQEVFGHEA